MATEEDLHKILVAFSPVLIKFLKRSGFFDLEGTYDPQDFWQSIPANLLTAYGQKSVTRAKAVFEVVKASFIPEGLQAGGRKVAGEYNLPKPTAAFSSGDLAKAYYDKHGLEFVKNLSDVDKRKLQAFIWANAGVNERPLARQIVKEPNLGYILDYNQTRAKAIKRTEIARATNYGSQAFAAENDFKENTWHTAGDSKVRREHRANNGKTVKIGELFPSGESFPGEKTVNCRCHLSFSV